MVTKEEINRLFQKLIDKTISAEELELFYSYVQQSEHDPQIRQHLVELQSQINLPKKHHDDGFSEATRLFQEKQRLLGKLVEENRRQYREITAAIEKIEEKRHGKRLKNKICRLWRWLRRFFGV